MGDTKFNVWTFRGVIRYKSNGTELEEMSLEKCLKDVFNTVWDNTVKKFFNNRNMSFVCREYSAEELWKEVEKGLAIFSISENTSIDEVKSYMKIGLFPVFMKAMDLKKLKKIWG